MKITFADGVVIECTVEEFNQVFSDKEDKPKYQTWMDRFDPEGIDVLYSFAWETTPEGDDWWRDNRRTHEGLARFEEMKREYAAWKATQ